MTEGTPLETDPNAADPAQGAASTEGTPPETDPNVVDLAASMYGAPSAGTYLIEPMGDGAELTLLSGSAGAWSETADELVLDASALASLLADIAAGTISATYEDPATIVEYDGEYTADDPAAPADPAQGAAPTEGAQEPDDGEYVDPAQGAAPTEVVDGSSTRAALEHPESSSVVAAWHAS